MRYTPIDSSLFQKNRQRLIAKLPVNSLVVLNSNDIMPTNADGEMPFKQNSDLFYLTGIDQEETVLVIGYSLEKSAFKSILFIKRTDELIRVWEGNKLSKEQACDLSGIDEIYWEDEFSTVFPDLVENVTEVFLNANEHARATRVVQTKDQRFTTWCKRMYPNKRYSSIAPVITSLRYVKSELELTHIGKACDITEKAFRRVLEFVKEGVYEYEIEAEIIHEFIKNGSRGHAYQPIIASGVDSCVLHYTSNDKKCQKGDVLLMDFGAEYGNYNADLTRTIPVSGKFNQRQKAVYNAVLNVMKVAKTLLVAGNTFGEYNKEVGIAMEQELIQLGLLDSIDVKKQDPKKPLYRKYFMHGTSHSLGLDVHDVDDRSIPFEEGMVFTCEPGIYIPQEKIGVRLENDICIKSKGNTDLMRSIPIEVEEVESLMN